MALHLLEREREGGKELARALGRALEGIRRCRACRNFTSAELCGICASELRSGAVICVVESPADVMAIEQATAFKGRYFVLLGKLSPLDGIGPEDLGLDLLSQRFATESIEEVVIATNSTVEGEATAHYIAGLAARHAIRITRLAQGVPLGGELEYTDQSTLAHAFASRQVVTG